MKQKAWQDANGKEAGFSKQQLLAARRYTPAQKDVLSAVMDEQDKCTHEQALSRITAYLKKEVM
ncbi:hypothetical protein [Paenibacillus luteus]|uniref:hypothetical protein n=1 Tax=Paenibacillus luteus TaxID=2545753 RepID=UPI001144801C|nr:hypothetical protein [Paenibacillus luteus]